VHRRRDDEALADLDQALALDGSIAAAYAERGAILQSLRDLDRAAADFSRLPEPASRQLSTNSSCCCTRAVCCCALSACRTAHSVPVLAYAHLSRSVVDCTALTATTALREARTQADGAMRHPAGPSSWTLTTLTSGARRACAIAAAATTAPASRLSPGGCSLLHHPLPTWRRCSTSGTHFRQVE
jgi:hypothetical protein